jgi:hypothetical protein
MHHQGSFITYVITFPHRCATREKIAHNSGIITYIIVIIIIIY